MTSPFLLEEVSLLNFGNKNPLNRQRGGREHILY
jgi:hypothetical protein